MVLAISAAALAAFMLANWALSVKLADASIVDVAWGIAFVIVAWVSFAVGDGEESRRLLLAILITIWGVRLAAYIGWRKLRNPGEDRRYTAMRERQPDFVLRSLFTIFLFQGVVAWVVSLPVQVSADEAGALGWLDDLGISVFIIGLGFEAIGDAQLARFKADPANKGKIMDRGLWKYTRHPNYFGDFCVWWGIWLIALSAGAWWTFVGPLAMSVLLIRVSGAGLTEKLMSGRPGFAEYVERTSGFFPMPPKG